MQEAILGGPIGYGTRMATPLQRLWIGDSSVSVHHEGPLDRRSFLSLTTWGVFRLASTYSHHDSPTEEYWNTQGYRVTQVLRRVDQILVQRDEQGDGLRVEFVDYETMHDASISVELPAPLEVGFYAVGSIPYELSLWFRSRGSVLEVFVTLDSTARATILVHQERGNAIVVLEKGG
jgi:hypothetical protein